MRRIGALLVAIGNLGVLAMVGAVAWRFADAITPRSHGAVFTGGSVIGGVLLAFGLQVFSKLDRLLTDVEKYDYARVDAIYSYVTRARRRVVVALLVSLVALVAAAAAAYIVKDAENGPVRVFTVVVGYVAVAAVALMAVRIVSGYLSLDRFRLDLIRIVTGEERRLATLREMRDPNAIGKFTDDAPPHIGTLHTVRG